MAKILMTLNSFLAKGEFANEEFDAFLADAGSCDRYELKERFDVEGRLYVKRPIEATPKWCAFIGDAAEINTENIKNKSNSAVLLVKVEGQVYAFAFGYGRFMLDLAKFEPDFGLKAALNTLRADSLRSVDMFTLDDQAVQKRAQAVRESQIAVFGVDVSKDVLRAVTGTPMSGVPFRTITGGDSIFSFSMEIEFSDIERIAKLLFRYYNQQNYLTHFHWVDNIKRVKNTASLDRLNAELVEVVRQKDAVRLNLMIPEIMSWDEIIGFSYTRDKKEIHPILDSSDYLSKVNNDSLSLDSIKSDRIYIHHHTTEEKNFSIYKCIYFEKVEGDITFIFYSGQWYEINSDFCSRINTTLARIPICNLPFPQVYTWDDGGKKKVEAEGDYNIRAARANGYHLLDKKLVKSNTTTSAIELCDLFSDEKHLVHAKHSKGGSSSLSHLFAQGKVSAEVMLGDRLFRKEARKVLRNVHANLPDHLPLDGFKSSDYEVVFLVLGEPSNRVIARLPFFSKVNLSNTFENLSQRGFKVSVCGVGVMPKP